MGTFQKHPGNPIYGGGNLGTVFDVYVTKTNSRYRMDFSWRPKKSCAVCFSDDGIHFSSPIITMPPQPESGWEDNINRNCVIFADGLWRMWYTGQARGYSFIGYAESEDGIAFRRFSDPVLIPERPWENASVMNPCVLYEDGRYRMWYSAGETYEPNVLAYAESPDGIHWQRARCNPIFVAQRQNAYEQNRIGGCQVLRQKDGSYLMFYIGYADIHTACICAARSPDGVTRWERSPLNPLVTPTPGEWDAASCYKPSAIAEESGGWRIWYNGRLKDAEYIGLATHPTWDLFPKP